MAAAVSGQRRGCQHAFSLRSVLLPTAPRMIAVTMRALRSVRTKVLIQGSVPFLESFVQMTHPTSAQTVIVIVPGAAIE